MVGLLTLSGCASMEPMSSGKTEGGPAASMEELVAQVPPGESVALEAAAAGDSGRDASAKPTITLGSGKMVNPPPVRKPVRYRGEAVSLDFEQAPLTDIVHAVMGDILGLDYVVEHPIGGEVTLRTSEPVPRDQLLDILESLLKANNVLMIRDNDGRFFISGSGQMQRLKPSMAASSAGVAGFTNLIIPLEFISARNMAEILRPVAEDSAFVRVDNLRNLLVLAGTRAQLQGWQEIIDTFDVDLLAGMSVGVFPIENAPIEEVEEALNGLLGGGSGDDMTEGLLGIGSVVRIIAMPRLSSIMVVTPRKEYLFRLGDWIKRLDREPDANFERRLYVYPVQNSHAVHLADLLGAVYGGGGGSSSSRSRSGVAPGLTPETVSGGDSNASTAGSASRSSVGGGSRGGSSSLDMDGVRVVADDENNALLIYATAKEYGKIKPALAQLDVAATQVIIEASILEVTLTDNLRYGLEWTFDNGLDNGYEGIAQLVGGEGIGAIIPGFSYQVVSAAGQIEAVLNALATENLLNVISSPSVMVLDNQTATIRVGDQVPIQQGSTINDQGLERFSITYKDTGVKLSVTPSVNAGGMVTMDIEQTVTDVGPVDADGVGQRTFLEREIISQVAVRSTETVVLGGLIRENKSAGSEGIPFLHSLPLIGPLFGAKNIEDTRTELLVVITPRVIYSESELREVSREMRSKMRGFDLIDPESLQFLSK